MSIIGDIYYKWKNANYNRKELKEITDVIDAFINDESSNQFEKIDEIKSYYRNGGRSPFPYNLEESFDAENLEILYDSLPYVIHNARKLYFPKTFTENKIRQLYKGLVIEQNKKCPHCYTQNDFEVPKDSVLIDVGCADAMFSLDHVENASKLILFEINKYWISALEKTFAPWKNKVEIVNAFVSDSDSDSTVTLDKFINSEDLDKSFYLKIDVEGAERQVLAGAKEFLGKGKKIQVAIAAYHYANDNDDLTKIFRDLSYHTSNTEGYILFFYDKKIKAPFLRRCILQAQKQ